MMLMYRIRLQGCDGTTVADVDVPSEYVAFLEQLAEQVNSCSSYGCEPKMYVDRLIAKAAGGCADS